jgi:DNA repair protein RecO (recombination protein O)
MLYTTRGIVIHTVRYSESNVIAKIFTEVFGLKSYMFRGVFKARARVKANLLQHLNLVELVADDHDRNSIQNPRELRIEHPYSTLSFNVRKSSVALFINEMLYRAIRHEENDAALFGFIRESLIWFDETTDNAVNFHLWFCLNLTRYLGFFPGKIKQDEDFFNLSEGNFQKSAPAGQHFIEPPYSNYFRELISCNAEDLQTLIIPHAARTVLTGHIVNYYKLHINDFGDIHSHHILAEVLS